METDLFLITSVINTGNKPWSYTHTRTCFTPEERLRQTLETINSIRTYHKSAKIMLIECSDIDTNINEILQKNVDYFIQTFNEKDLREACLESNKKGFGEVREVKKGCEIIQNENILFRRIFKICGRYKLNSSFNTDNFPVDKFGFDMTTSTSSSTILYSVPYNLFSEYKNNIEKCDNFYSNNPPTSLEDLLANMCNPKIHIQTLGVCGNIGVYNWSGNSDYINI